MTRTNNTPLGSNRDRVSHTRVAKQIIGGVPPFGHTARLRVFIDPDLLQYDEVWAAAGTWHDVFALSPADLERVSGGTVTDLRR
jgi:prolyl-tRNA editing enzyme YbaK/EbsC (Cys-tRNA(Pro) deacylase)